MTQKSEEVRKISQQITKLEQITQANLQGVRDFKGFLKKTTQLER
jgi:archaellum component FlaC